MRPRSLTLLLTAGLTLAATGSANAARLELARRVEPSLDPYLKTPFATTPLDAMTADQRWLGAPGREIVAHDSDPTVSLNLTGWATKPKIAVYRNATGVNLGVPTQLEATKSFSLFEQGQPVIVDGWRALDVTKPAARQWWLYGTDGKVSCNPDRDSRGALDLYACGYRSLWLDNALTTPKQGFKPTPSIPERTWAAGMLAMLRQLRALKPAGTTFTINMHWTDTDFGYADKPKLTADQPQIQAARLADQVIIEGGAIDPGLHYAIAAKYPWSYPRLLEFADAMHRQGVALQWEKTNSSNLTRTTAPIPGSPTYAPLPECQIGDGTSNWVAGDATWKAHVRSAAFNDATALLTLGKGDGVGDMCEYPGRGWRGYDADLGSPRGKRKQVGKLIVRTFSAGIVAVNPSDRAVRFATGRPGIDLASQAWPVTDTVVRAVKLPPRTAAVVKYR